MQYLIMDISAQKESRIREPVKEIKCLKRRNYDLKQECQDLRKERRDVISQVQGLRGEMG